MKEENVLHVEVCQYANSTLSKEIIEETVSAEFKSLKEISLDIILYGKDFVNSIIIQNHVESIICSSNYIEKGNIKIEGAIVKYYIYRLTQEGVATETMNCDSDELPVASHWLLPTQEFHYMWESLYYDCDIKNNSGKLVMKLFDEIKNLVQDERALVCILIDEIESLAHARKSCNNGTEPSDSIRVVNALLTQLDQIKRYPNVLILTTSNMTEAIDLAFIDRADIKQYLGYPSEIAIYNIYHSCLKELMRSGILEREEICDISQLKLFGYTEDPNTKNSLKLLELSRASEGLSGRTLRKIPFLAHALHLSTDRTTLSKFLKAMHSAILKQMQQEGELQQS